MTTEKNIQLSLMLFEPKLASDFARLNYQWLEEYFTIEPHDREMLDHPESFIIEPGGQILFACLAEEIVGTVALVAADNDTFELAKMGVSPAHRGKKIGQFLMDEAITYSKRIGIKRLVLESNTKLTPALNLYSKNGFKPIPLNTCSPYSRCNISMELLLS